MEMNQIRMRAPYPKKEGSPLLRRLCWDAWKTRFDPELGEDTREAIRMEVIRAVSSCVDQKDVEVLRRYRGTVMAESFRISPPNSHGMERAALTGSLGTRIEVPILMAKGVTVQIAVIEPSPVLAQGGLRLPMVEDWIGGIIRGRMEGWGGYAAEDGLITEVNRATGTVPWRRILEAIPRTHEHVLAEIEAQKEGSVHA